MAVVRIPWARAELSSRGNISAGRFVLPDNGSAVYAYTQRTAVPAAQVTVTFDVLKRSGTRNFMAGMNSTMPVNLDGGIWRPINGATSAPPAAVTWSPTWALPAGWNQLDINALGTSGQIEVAFSHATTDWTAPLGVESWWDGVASPSTFVGTYDRGWAGPNGPADLSNINNGAGALFSVRKSWTGQRTFSVPILPTGTAVKVAIEAGTGTATLLDAGAATDNGDGTVTVASGVAAVVKWSATDGVVLTAEKLGAPSLVLSYSPFYIETPIVPPTLPTFDAITPTEGPTTGGTLLLTTGTNLEDTTAVHVGTRAATLLATTPGALLIRTPTGTPGPANVTATDGTHTTNPIEYTYTSATQPTGETDFEGIAVTALRASPALAALLNPDNIATRLRRGWNPQTPAVRVQRIGGLPTDTRTEHLNRGRLQIESYAPNEPAALQIANTAAAALRTLTTNPPPGAAVSAVHKDLGLHNSPDPDSDAARYVFGVVIYAHTTA